LTWTARDWCTLSTTFSNIGLGVSGGKDGVAATATFDNIRIGPFDGAIMAPDAPANFRVQELASGLVRLAWNQDPVGVDGYELERATADGPFAPLVDLESRTYGA